MGDDNNLQEHPGWEAAWAWVLHLHETPQLPDDDKVALAHWLAEAPGHRALLDEASRVWHLAGLLPPVHPVDIPGSD